MKIYLDDVRVPRQSYDYMVYRIGELRDIYLDDWLVVRNYEHFIDVINKFHKHITCVSFDHDLFPDPRQTDRNGLACAKWMKQFYIDNNQELPIIYIHSMNIYGIQYIAEIFPKSYR
jgi:hypothetical protein